MQLDRGAEGDQLNSIEELRSAYKSQQARIEALEEQVETLQEQMQEQTQEMHQASQKMEEAAKQLDEGKLSGEAGAELLAQLIEFRPRNKTEARAWWLYQQIVKRRKVGQPVKTSTIAEWRPDHAQRGDDPYFNTANPHQTIHRAMDKLIELHDEGLLLGTVETYLHRGTRVIQVGDGG